MMRLSLLVGALGHAAAVATMVARSGVAQRAAAPRMADSVTLTEEQLKAYGGEAVRPLTPTGGAAPAAAPAGIAAMEGAAHETGFAVFDPLGLATLGSPATLAWFRHAELKHGRVCMAAFVGWLVAVSGLHFPGLISPTEGVSFADLSKLSPLAQWSAVPATGKLQMLLAIGFIEHQSEWKVKPHYMAGGTPGDLKPLKKFWDPVGFVSKLSPEKLERQRLAEIKNGRLAMLGVAGCVLFGGSIPGSIPVPIAFPDAYPFVMPF